jgi:hypothetical protein
MSMTRQGELRIICSLLPNNYIKIQLRSKTTKYRPEYLNKVKKTFAGFKDVLTPSH